jgi:hypothetical protein
MSADDAILHLRFGPYVTPVCIVGAVVECEVRGLVTVAGLSDGAIAWPVGEREGREELVVFKGLARAVRQESPEAVARAWGVSLQTARHWHSACNRPRLRRKQTLSSPPIPWKKAEDELLAHVSLAEAARLTGRTLTAVRKRRRILGLPDGRVAAQRAAKSDTLEQQAAAARLRMRCYMEELARSQAELNETCQRAKANLTFWQVQAHQPFDTASPSP